MRTLLAIVALAQTGEPGRAQTPTAAPSTETWADAGLREKRGLVLWLDASRQPQAYAAANRAAPGDGRELGVWYDGSGLRRDALQRNRSMQPRFVAAGGGALVRFDGVDDFLAASGVAHELHDFTLFVHAAPRTNRGWFGGLVSANATGRNDYTSGFNLDLGGGATPDLSVVNVEGRGFGGAVDLLKRAFDFGPFHTFTVRAGHGKDGVELLVDGRSEGRRDRSESTLAADELSIGARFYSNDSDVPAATGFLDGDVTEVLLYDRLLDDEESASVERWLAEKHAPLVRALAATARLHQVVLERTPPATESSVSILAPGFTARELPVQLNNVNNLAWREDGTLVALGYDGNVWLLNDKDGDGLPETVRHAYENRGSITAPIGMALTPPNYKRGRGLFVACRSMLLLLLDRNGDDVIDDEIVVATGWPPLHHDVDALGVAVAPDGRLYFGLGTSDYTNAYLVDAAGAGHYDLASERGTILEVDPDFKTRRIFCTGIRFPVGIHFDRAGELFATDQEGATWLANGNPFDELLHLERGRHYGFPPRHPRHLPRVIDEPSLFDYKPQHQSTCGFCFDEPAQGHPTFGPASWDGDLFVAGYSRGKLFRTELAPSRAGDVARNRTFASFAMLACDVALAPDGSLTVACHSGFPDWGSGPSGKGRLFQLKETQPAAPQPVAVYAAGPQEVRVAFDRPLDPRELEGAAKSARIEFGSAVGAADRLEPFHPGYEAVERQLAAPRYELKILSTRLGEDRRTLSLVTEPHALRVPHALQLKRIDLAYDLCGVEAEWSASDGGDSWSGWLPHADLAVARRFTNGSREHERLWESVQRPGRLTLRGALDLTDMLRPAIQPGARIDYEWPEEVVTLVVRAGARAEVSVAGERKSALGGGAGGEELSFTVKPKRGGLTPFVIAVVTGGAGDAKSPSPTLDLAWHTNEDGRARALELRRFVMPWVAALERGGAEEVGAALVEAGTAPRPELAGGNWSRGRAVFFGEEAMCFKCHTLDDGSGHGARGRVGPDLTQLWQRDVASVRRDVLDPSAAINPDYIAFSWKLADGRELAGVPRREDATHLVIGEAGGKETVVTEGEVVSREPLTTSVMPAGLQNVLSKQQLVDLLTYVLTRPPEPAPIEIEGAPPPRKRAELANLLKESSYSGRGTGTGTAAAGVTATVAKATDGTPQSPASPAPLHLLLVAGPKDHGLNEHDYPDWQRRWSRLLPLADGVSVETADGWPSAAQLASADAILMFSANPGWNAARAPELDSFLARGGGLVLMHYAINGRDAVPEFAQRTGLAWRDGASRFRHGALDLVFPKDDHEITRGLDLAPLHLIDETYWNLEGDARSIDVLATSTEEGEPRPQLWTREFGRGRGRIFVSLLGHFRWTFDDPLYRRLLLRAIAWTAHQPVERLEPLATVGARIAKE